MGACLSCLSGRKESDDVEQQRLLHDDPYAHHQHNYGSWSQPGVPPQDVMSPEEVRREQQALNDITRWASDQIVEIFPHRNNLSHLSSQTNLGASMISHGNDTSTGSGMTSSAHQDILLSMIPGDKSKRSIRIYPASRPGSRADGESIRSKASLTKINRRGSGKGTDDKSVGQEVFVTLNVDLP